MSSRPGSPPELTVTLQPNLYMENIGALSVLLAFCLAVFAVAAALAGKYGGVLSW